jgi:hypothetical protein
MKAWIIAVGAAAAALTVAACDKAKERTAGDAPIPAAPSAPGPATATAGAMSGGLALRPEFPGFYLDHIGTALDPLKNPATVEASAALVFDGFAYDPVSKQPAKGVDVEVDGKLYPTAYGTARPDVAAYTKNPALGPVGYKGQLPAGTLAAGPHQARVRIVSTDGTAYYQSPVINFTVR